jgi:hypothetical protein
VTYRTIVVEPLEIPAVALRNRVASMTGRFVRPDTVLVDKEGVPLLVHATFPGSVTRLRTAVELIPMSSGMRAQGQRSHSRSFGWMPRNPVYQQFGCRKAYVHETHPASGAALEVFTADVSDVYRRLVPDVAGLHQQMVAEVKPEYLLPGGLFTAGIINHTWAVRYHLDRKNFQGSWSAMVVVRRGTLGGHLDIPQLGVTLECGDASLTLFDGQRFWHGVSPISRDGRDPYRRSIVWYSRSDMCHCLDLPEERAQALQRETESATRKAEIVGRAGVG